MPTQKTHRINQYRRIALLHDLLSQATHFTKQRYEKTNSELGRQLGEVSWRTIQRDLERLKDDFQAPLVYNHQRGYYYQDPSFQLPGWIISIQDLLPFILSQVLLKQFQNTPWHQPLDWLIKQAQTQKQQDSSLILSPSFFSYFDQSYLPDIRASLIQDIATAISQTRKIKMHYHSFSGQQQSQRTVHPYHIFGYQGQWYMVAWCQTRKAFRDFSLGRIKTYSLLNKNFSRSQDFQTKKYLHERCLGIEKTNQTTHVELFFTLQQGQYIAERRWHHTQKIIKETHGYRVTLNLGITSELLRWILSYGSQVEVIKPLNLKEQITKEIAKMQQIYHSKP